MNLLEEPIEELKLASETFKGETTHEVRLGFRGFEIKTVKLYLEKAKDRRGSSGSWVKI